MNKLPPTAARLLAEARHADREHRVDLEQTLVMLHANIALSGELPQIPSEAGPQPTDLASQPPPAALESIGSGALFGSKAVKVFLATVALGALGGGALLGAQPKPVATHTPVAIQQPATLAAVVEEERAAPESGGAIERTAENPNPRAASSTPALPQPAEVAPGGESRIDHGKASIAPAPRRQRGVTRPSQASTARAPRDQAMAPQADRADEMGDRRQASEKAQARADDRPPSTPDTNRVLPSQPERAAASELDLIEAVLASLRDRDAAHALALLESHAAPQRAGRFATEREGLRVVALCALGRVEEGRIARAAFLRASHGAPISARVRAACTDGARED